VDFTIVRVLIFGACGNSHLCQCGNVPEWPRWTFSQTAIFHSKCL